MSERIEGKVTGVKIANGKFLRCQADATLNMTINTEQDEECKDLSYTATDVSGVGSALTYNTQTASSVDWSIDVNRGMFYDSLVDETDFIDEVINKNNVEFEVQFVIPSKGAGTQSRVFSGNAILTTISVNAPVAGKVSEDLTFTGNGKPTWTVTSFTA